MIARAKLIRRLTRLAVLLLGTAAALLLTRHPLIGSACAAVAGISAGTAFFMTGRFYR